MPRIKIRKSALTFRSSYCRIDKIQKIHTNTKNRNAPEEREDTHMATIIGEGITFDDVLLVPSYSEVTPNMIDLSTKLTNKISLNIPMMSASMDTVTEHRMAIAMARQGGIGIIHKNMSVEAQAEEVDKVKRSENGVITDPFSLSEDNTLADADDLMAKFRISGVPITNEGKLVGIITNRDLKFETDYSKKIKDCMTSEGLITAQEGITLEQAKQILAKARKEKLPIVDKDNNLKGTSALRRRRRHYVKHDGPCRSSGERACGCNCRRLRARTLQKHFRSRAKY